MRITYIIRQPDDPRTTEVAGYRFIAGAATEVHDPEIITMLAGNPWFRVEGFRPLTGDLSEINRDPTPKLVRPRKYHKARA